jgi:hypothetical protein
MTMADQKKAPKKKPSTGSNVSAVSLQKTLEKREKDRKKMLEEMYR